LRPQLWELFPAGFAPEQVRRAAIGTLHEAITIAEEVGAWQFAAIQANRLMRVLDAAGRTEEATSWARRAEDFAGRVGARDQRLVGAVRLAMTALAGGDGETALAHLSTAALEDVRSAVSPVTGSAKPTDPTRRPTWPAASSTRSRRVAPTSPQL
jgi:hypothetical protein